MGKRQTRQGKRRSKAPVMGQGRQQTVVEDKQCKGKQTQKDKHKGILSVMIARQIRTSQSS